MNYWRAASAGVLVNAAALLLRLSLVAYGEWQDENLTVKYTDVDYRVFTDGARLVSQGRSPYERATYRYSPLLAWLLVPNVVLHRVWGKLLFAAADVAVGAVIAGVLRARGRASPGYAPLLWSCVWLFNPLVFTVSTRGSSDSLVCLLVVLCLDAALRRKAVRAGLLLGAAAHLRVYPVIYVPVVAALLASDPSGGGSRLARWPRAVAFGLSAAGVFAALGLWSWWAYGDDFVRETYLYHLSRRDHRHNFSLFFYELYLTGSSFDATPGWLYFAPQVFAVLLFAGVYGSRWPELSMLLVTMGFVAFNKVVTAQYFVWYYALLPLVLAHTDLGPLGGALTFAVWLASELHWLYWAYRVEFLGESVFAGVWAAGAIFFAVNIGLMVRIIVLAGRRPPSVWPRGAPGDGDAKVVAGRAVAKSKPATKSKMQ